MHIDRHSGWLQDVRRCPSPNFDQRPADTVIGLLVVHGISLPPGEYGGDYIEHLFTNKLDQHAHPYFGQITALRVSAHALIRRDGELTQFVPFHQRAWHAGESSFGGRSQCNDFSIGIELEGCDDQPYRSAQYEALARLSHASMQRWPGITTQTIVGHCDIAPGRKTDPGPAFDWQRFRDLLNILNGGQDAAR